MKLYVGYDVEGDPTSVLIAEDRMRADIAWAGMNEIPHKVEELDCNNMKGVHGLVFLLTSTKMNSGELSHRLGGVDFRQWKRGL